MANKTHTRTIEVLSNDTLRAEARVIANFAWQHLKAATLFRDRVVQIEIRNKGAEFGPFFEELRSYGSACIMSATASVEALINELFIAPSLRLRPTLGDFEAEFWGKGGIEKKRILDKYQLALKIVGATPFEEDADPYRSASALIGLRNALVHYKPTWDPDRPRKEDLLQVLAGSYELSPFPDAGADFVTMKSMSAGCVNWSISTALAFIKEFDMRTNLDPRKMSSFYTLASR